MIVGYFLEGRSSLELAKLLDVTESRISQLRSEALQMLRDGIEAQYTAAGEPRRTVVPPVVGRTTRPRSATPATGATASPAAATP